MTTIYLIRHSKPLKVNNTFNNDSLQIQNEKSSLSIEGEQIAQEKLNKNEFDNIDILFSSNYVRAIQTAKYLSTKDDLEINVISDLGERKFGINSWNELPESFERKQFLDENYKIGNGESQKEVSNRMYSTIMKILRENKNKRIAIVSHATAISYLLKKWCDIQVVDDKLKYSFNNNILLNGYFNYCETFKLEFDDNYELISIQNINLD
ncbi:MAG: histidine phosphatase family protein [Bacilli bacterium]|nr:histidine phosphatase family protein [Bacilli bacterium]CDE95946.1 phosphoglycerate mutase family protein [Clostridium sp. CAG:914]